MTTHNTNPTHTMLLYDRFYLTLDGASLPGCDFDSPNADPDPDHIVRLVNTNSNEPAALLTPDGESFTSLLAALRHLAPAFNPYHPVKADIKKLGDGMLGVIRKHPDGACLALGMLPAGIMEAFDKMLAEKIPDAGILNGTRYDHGKEIREDITRAVTSHVISLGMPDEVEPA